MDNPLFPLPALGLEPRLRCDNFGRFLFRGEPLQKAVFDQCIGNAIESGGCKNEVPRRSGIGAGLPIVRPSIHGVEFDLARSHLGRDRRAGLAKAMRGAVRNACFGAPVLEPVSECRARREGLAVAIQQDRQSLPVRPGSLGLPKQRASINAHIRSVTTRRSSLIKASSKESLNHIRNDLCILILDRH
jgi:hypothetical protein